MFQIIRTWIFKVNLYRLFLFSTLAEPVSVTDCNSLSQTCFCKYPDKPATCILTNKKTYSGSTYISTSAISYKKSFCLSLTSFHLLNLRGDCHSFFVDFWLGFFSLSVSVLFISSCIQTLTRQSGCIQHVLQEPSDEQTLTFIIKHCGILTGALNSGM